MDRIKRKVSYYYFRYELVTCLYMIEPWEKVFLNASLGLIASLLCYFFYTYLPLYVSVLSILWRLVVGRESPKDEFYTLAPMSPKDLD